MVRVSAPTEEGQAYEVVANGRTEDGRIFIDATLGDAKISVEWDSDAEEDHIDVLLTALPRIIGQVLDTMVNAQKSESPE